MSQRIRLRGINGEIEGKTWESDSLLRAGRLATLEVILDDASVSRRHAEVRATPQGWRIRDMGSTNGTFLNGARLGPQDGEKPVRPHDIIRCGNVTLVVDVPAEEKQDDEYALSSDKVHVEACSRSWEDAIQGIAGSPEQSPGPGQQLLTLLRASHHLVHLESEEDLLHTILHDAVSTLDAQRGAIVLAEGPTGPLKVRALANGKSEISSRTNFSNVLAQRSFSRGESILCSSVEEDAELACARSVAEGTMSSVLCVLLRTPRKKLGVLHLDRGPLQAPFTTEDLHLADALAAHVSFGIESAQLLRKQRELFYSTVSVLAQLVDEKDEYTGGHTRRVTEFSVLLGQELDLSQEDLHLIRIGTPLHDIGKIGIPDKILKAERKLTDEETKIMRTHTCIGAKILDQVPGLAAAVPIVRSHHERWDGLGYPDGLKGEEISHLARIVAIADAFDAMTSDRPYRKGMPAEAAFTELEKQKGRQFDPHYVFIFLKIRQRIVQEMQAETKKFIIPNQSNPQLFRLAN